MLVALCGKSRFAKLIFLTSFNRYDYTITTTALHFLNFSVLSLKCSYCSLTERHTDG